LPEQLVNNAASTLSAAIPDAVATSLTVANGTVFPATGNFRVIVDTEIMLCTARTGNTLTVTRGVETTSAAAHANGAAVTQVLTKGGLDQYLKENTNPPAVRVVHGGTQSIANNTQTSLAFNQERFDNDTMHDLVTNNSRLTCNTPGIYLISGNVEWAVNATGIRTLIIQHSIAGAIARISRPGAATYPLAQSVTCLWNMAAGQWLTLDVYQDSGVALNVNLSANYSPEFSMVKVA
jgi:hypothetical protein